MQRIFSFLEVVVALTASVGMENAYMPTNKPLTNDRNSKKF
jgi:hypothetical protein